MWESYVFVQMSLIFVVLFAFANNSKTNQALAFKKKVNPSSQYYFRDRQSTTESPNQDHGLPAPVDKPTLDDAGLDGNRDWYGHGQGRDLNPNIDYDNQVQFKSSNYPGQESYKSVDEEDEHEQNRMSRKDKHKNEKSFFEVYFLEFCVVAIVVMMVLGVLIRFWQIRPELERHHQMATALGGEKVLVGGGKFARYIYVYPGEKGHGSGASSNVRSGPERELPSVALKPLKCPKPACVCSTEASSGSGSGGGGRRVNPWRKTDNEAYAPSSNA